MYNQSLIYQFDFLTLQPTLSIFHQSRYPTIYGTILSILVILCSIGFGLYFLINFFNRKDINLVSLQETSGYYNGFNLSDSLFLALVNYYCDDVDENGDSIIDGRNTLTLSGMYGRTSKHDADSEEYNYFYDVKFEPCTEEHLPLSYRYKNATPYPLSEFQCLAPGRI